MRLALVGIQGATFAALAVVFLREGDWRLGIAQALLAGVTVAVYA